MFTGIIKSLGVIEEAKHDNGQVTLMVKPIKKLGKIKLGDSIAVNGVCLTVARLKKNMPVFFCQKQTVSVTNIGLLKKGEKVNLERAMKMGDEFGGHIVQGHVDATVTCAGIEKKGEGWRYWVKLPSLRPKGVVLKGSIALDGISLTISDLKKDRLSVDIIPFTYENTNIQGWQKNTIINLETDVLGKYVENYLKALKNDK